MFYLAMDCLKWGLARLATPPNTYKDIMAYYNKEVFGIDPQIVQEDNQDNQAPEDETIGLDEDDLEFMEFIGA
ncbi:hypothetical protein RSAG8_06250, partial [Rhizoctonia solani AG-8 WAC10335]